MTTTITEVVNLPMELYLKLDLHLLESQPSARLDTFVAGLVQDWLAIDKERLALSRSGPPLHGYQWKEVFLPEGTNLRTRYGDKTIFAKVVGERILYERTFVTPSQLANQDAKGRNAWRFVWLRFPGETSWIRAHDYRNLRKR